MKVSNYQMHFVGGPTDGLALDERRSRAQRQVRFPVCPALERRGKSPCYELVGQWSANYRLVMRQSLPAEPGTGIYARYEFEGYELTPLTPKRRSLVRKWLGDLARWFRQASSRIAKWMLAPIDHPLSTPIEAK